MTMDEGAEGQAVPPAARKRVGARSVFVGIQEWSVGYLVSRQRVRCRTTAIETVNLEVTSVLLWHRLWSCLEVTQKCTLATIDSFWK